MSASDSSLVTLESEGDDVKSACPSRRADVRPGGVDRYLGEGFVSRHRGAFLEVHTEEVVVLWVTGGDTRSEKSIAVSAT